MLYLIPFSQKGVKVIPSVPLSDEQLNTVRHTTLNLEEEEGEEIISNFELNLSMDMDIDFEEKQPDIISESVNKEAIKKFSIFIKVVNDYIETLDGSKKDSSKKYPQFRKPNLAFVPVASRGSAKDTPEGKQLRSVNPRTEDGSISSPSNYNKRLRKKTNEAQLYTKKLNSFFCFPRLRN